MSGQVFLYDGKTSELVGELGSPAHKGGVYGVAWSPDSKQLLTASGDKTCRLWDAAQRSLVAEFPMGVGDVEDQQVSCLWQGKHLLSVSLAGHITYLNVNDPKKPLRVVKGHNRAITVLSLSKDRQVRSNRSRNRWFRNGPLQYQDLKIHVLELGNFINNLFFLLINSSLVNSQIGPDSHYCSLNVNIYSNGLNNAVFLVMNQRNKRETNKVLIAKTC